MCSAWNKPLKRPEEDEPKKRGKDDKTERRGESADKGIEDDKILSATFSTKKKRGKREGGKRKEVKFWGDEKRSSGKPPQLYLFNITHACQQKTRKRKKKGEKRGRNTSKGEKNCTRRPTLHLFTSSTIKRVKQERGERIPKEWGRSGEKKRKERSFLSTIIYFSLIFRIKIHRKGRGKTPPYQERM